MGHSPQFRCIHRLHCVLLVGEGCSCPEVARWFGEDPRSIERWVHDYESEGISGLLDLPRRGRPPRLSSEQMDDLQRVLHRDPAVAGEDGRRWTGKVLQRYVERRLAVEMSVRQCQRLLVQLRQMETGEVDLPEQADDGLDETGDADEEYRLHSGRSGGPLTQ